MTQDSTVTDTMIQENGTEDAAVDADATAETNQDPDAPVQDGDKEVQDQEARDLWAQQAPELAGQYDKLTDEEKWRYLATRRAAPDTQEPPTKEPEPRARAGEAESGRPSVPRIRPLDPEQVVGRVAEAFENGDSDAFKVALNDLVGWNHEVLVAVNAALEQEDQRFGALSQQVEGLVRPSALRAALADVPIAEDADLPEAQKLLERGKAHSPEAALALAAARREGALRSVKRPAAQASDEAKRKAQAIAANRQTSTRFPGRSVDNTVHEDFTNDWGRSLMQDLIKGASK
jgi:hypothetical protein